jgi:hypothetical protein
MIFDSRSLVVCEMSNGRSLGGNVSGGGNLPIVDEAGTMKVR